MLLTVKNLSETHHRLRTNSGLSFWIMYFWVHWLLVLKIPILALWVLRWFSITTKKKSKLLRMRHKGLCGLGLLSLSTHSRPSHSQFCAVSQTCHAFNTYSTFFTMYSFFFCTTCSPLPPTCANSSKIVIFIWKPSWIPRNMPPELLIALLPLLNSITAELITLH